MMKPLEDFFTRPSSARGMDICRLGFGACLLFHYLNLAPDLFNVLGPKSLWAAYSTFGIMTSTWSVMVAYGLLLICIAMYMLGVQVLFAGATALILHALFYAQNPLLYDGWARLIIPFIAYTLLVPHKSLFQSLRHATLVPVWSRRLLQINLSTMYLTSAWARLHDPLWKKGDMVFYLLSDSKFHRLAVDWLPYRELLKIFCYAGWGLELLAPVMLWLPLTRVRWVYMLFALHLTIEILANTGMWQFLMMVALTQFLPDTEQDDETRQRAG